MKQRDVTAQAWDLVIKAMTMFEAGWGINATEEVFAELGISAADDARIWRAFLRIQRTLERHATKAARRTKAG